MSHGRVMGMREGEKMLLRLRAVVLWRGARGSKTGGGRRVRGSSTYSNTRYRTNATILFLVHLLLALLSPVQVLLHAGKFKVL